uniref:Uncharacterized protein n=1 Tax=Glossina palpalis gambiensis TaxID=67801 RepID=A0A1B0BCG2_9MUSC
MTLAGPPRAPNKSNSFMASNAALAIPIELAFNSGSPKSCKAVLCPRPFKEAEAASFSSGNKRLQALSESASRRNAGDKRKSSGLEEGDLTMDEFGEWGNM